MPQEARLSTFEALPSEIIVHILGYLSPQNLAFLSSTCTMLKTHADDDRLWERFVLDNVPSQVKPKTHSPAKSWQELYLSHHPFWFVSRNILWVSDLPNSGGLFLATYNVRDGSLIAHRVLAQIHSPGLMPWTHDPSVLVHDCNPSVYLWESDPELNLKFDGGRLDGKLRKEIKMDIQRHRYNASFSLCTRMPPEREHSSMSLWPPATIPSLHRVRNQSQSRFASDNQRPKSLRDASDKTCRIRKWLDIGLSARYAGARFHEVVETWTTLLEESYMPTKEKPFQGIWVGDYAVHGCEFLLVMHRLEGARPARKTLVRPSTGSGLPSGSVFTFDDEEDDEQTRSPLRGASRELGDKEHTENPEGQYVPSGGLEAIKLTGDINVPRGQCTWFADDISDSGLIQVASNDTFEGSRIVQSMGHVANEGFVDDRYIPSQLIMINQDHLAQYWEVSTIPAATVPVDLRTGIQSHFDVSESRLERFTDK